MMKGRTLPLVLLAVVALSASLAAGWLARRSLTPTVAVAAKSDARGEMLFQVYCAKCHGPSGRGDGESTANMQPPPRDFTLRPWKHGMEPAAIRQVIVTGIPRTAMPAMKQQLTEVDLQALVAHVLQLAAATPTVVRAETPAEKRMRAAGFVPTESQRPTPKLELQDAAGKEVRLADLRGKVVIVNFWGTTCVHCLQKLPQLAELESRFAPQGLAVLSVCADEDDAKTAQQVASQRAPGHTVYVDSTGLAQHEFNVQLLPTVWIVDRAGKLVARNTTAPDWGSKEFREMLQPLVDAARGESKTSTD